jgi:hypothetical protein
MEASMADSSKKAPSTRPTGKAVDDEDPDYIPMSDNRGERQKPRSPEEKLKSQVQQEIDGPLKGSA